MPVVPSSAYATVESITNLARAVVNDMIFSQSGEILTDSAPFTFVMINDALEWFTNEVNNRGVKTFIKETLMTPLTPTPLSTDPSVQVNVSDTGYFDGQLNHAQPQLPTDLLEPSDLWERQTGSTDDFRWIRPVPDGLPSIVPGTMFGMWEFRQDGLYMPGATQSNDIRLRYVGSTANLVTPNDTVFFRGATGPLGYKVASTYLISKNPEMAKLIAAEAVSRVNQISLRNSRMLQRQVITRQSYGRQRTSRQFNPPRNS